MLGRNENREHTEKCSL